MSEPMTRDGIVHGMPEAEYHGGPELSSTGAKKLLAAPALFKYEVLDGNREEKDVFDVGTVAHSLILGTGAQPIAYPEDVLSASGAIIPKSKEWAAEQRAAGLIPLKQAKVAEVNAMAEAVLAHPVARGFLEADGESEVSMFATCPTTGARIRARFDRKPAKLGFGIDVKTVGRRGGASDAEFTRTIFNLGYDVSAGHYVDTNQYITGEDVGFVFIAVESVAPYLVNVIPMSETYLSMGRTKSMRARALYMQCMESGEWPGYPLELKHAEPPMFAVYDYQDNYEDEGF